MIATVITALAESFATQITFVVVVLVKAKAYRLATYITGVVVLIGTVAEQCTANITVVICLLSVITSA